MNSPYKPAEASVQDIKQAPVAVFKNSLRAWQARYQAGRSSAPADGPKGTSPQNQASRGA